MKNLQIYQPMQLERVSTVSMSCILFKVAGKIDDRDGFKRTFLKGNILFEKQNDRLQSNECIEN